jgi:hypothetical protein
LERDVGNAVPDRTVLTQLKPVDDPAAWKDIGLDRTDRDVGEK